MNIPELLQQLTLEEKQAFVPAATFGIPRPSNGWESPP